MIYLQHFVVWKIIAALNELVHIENYECTSGKVKLMIPVYDTTTGEFLGFCKNVDLCCVREDENELFFSCDFDKNKWKVLYSAANKGILNAVIGTAFKKHTIKRFNKRADFLQVFSYLLCTTDRNGTIKQYLKNASHNPKDFRPEDFQKYSSSSSKFILSDLDKTGEKRTIAKEILLPIQI